MIAQCELGLEHRIETVAIWQGADQAPGFLALNPNGKNPVIVDDETSMTKPA